MNPATAPQDRVRLCADPEESAFGVGVGVGGLPGADDGTVRDYPGTVTMLLLLACTSAVDPPLAEVFVQVAGDPVPGLDPGRVASFERGRAVASRTFSTVDGLGPFFNADSCQGCHQVPTVGGAAHRYRDLFLVQVLRADGAVVDAGTNGQGPVRALYATAPVHHVPEPEHVIQYARRNAPTALGAGLFTFVSDATLLALEDPDDADGDGVSGRVAWDQAQVGRFGAKAQAATLEAFNRGALLNQLGVTTNPLLHHEPEDPRVATASRWRLVGLAHAQVAASDEPTVDADAVADPELTDADQLDLLRFSTWLGVPAPAEGSAEADAGAQRFEELGCVACHLPRVESTLGPLPAYTDLLLHDLGPELDDGVTQGVASGAEWRTAPLWGVALTGPWLHDGRAESLETAVLLHGGEASACAEAFAALGAGARGEVVAFLESLGGDPSANPWQVLEGEPVPEPESPGGPDGLEGPEDEALWLAGRALFDRTRLPSEGLGQRFNADSCRSCHQDPVLGGAGGIDVNVLRVGARASDGAWVPIEPGVLFRASVPGVDPARLDDATTVIEPRQPTSVLGAGRIEAIADAAILANEDPEDLDGDGVRGVARRLDGGAVGRFGWKAQFATVRDFVNDAAHFELGMLAPDADELAALTFFSQHLAPPLPPPDGPGRAVFDEVGCGACHRPELDGAPIYSDLLLHDVAADPEALVEQDPGVPPGTYRTPPLWGVSRTGPWWHDGRSPTLDDAIGQHAGSAQTAADAYAELSGADQAALLDWLAGL